MDPFSVCQNSLLDLSMEWLVKTILPKFKLATQAQSPLLVMSLTLLITLNISRSQKHFWILKNSCSISKSTFFLVSKFKMTLQQ